MTATIVTHIETVNKRAGAGMWRVVTGAGIYDLEPNSPVAEAVDQHRHGNVKLTVEVIGRSSRIMKAEPIPGAGSRITHTEPAP